MNFNNKRQNQIKIKFKLIKILKVGQPKKINVRKMRFWKNNKNNKKLINLKVRFSYSIYKIRKIIKLIFNLLRIYTLFKILNNFKNNFS